jgi:hypothetical protein
MAPKVWDAIKLFSPSVQFERISRGKVLIALRLFWAPLLCCPPQGLHGHLRGRHALCALTLVTLTCQYVHYLVISTVSGVCSAFISGAADSRDSGSPIRQIPNTPQILGPAVFALLLAPLPK